MTNQNRLNSSGAEASSSLQTPCSPSAVLIEKRVPLAADVLPRQLARPPQKQRWQLPPSPAPGVCSSLHASAAPSPPRMCCCRRCTSCKHPGRAGRGHTRRQKGGRGFRRTLPPTPRLRLQPGGRSGGPA